MKQTLWKAVPLLVWLNGAIFGQHLSVDVDAGATKINWSLGGNVHTTHGTFQMKQGHVEVDASTGAVSGELLVPADSGNSGDGLRDKRMKKEVLETDKYPEIRLKVTKIEGVQALREEGTVQVVGEFTIHGTSHEVKIPMQVKINGSDLSGTGKFDIPFVDWGMKDPSNFLFKVDKTVHLELSLAGHIKR